MITCPTCGRCYDPAAIGITDHLARAISVADSHVWVTVVCEDCQSHFDTHYHSENTPGKRNWRKCWRRDPATTEFQVTTYVR